MDKQGVEEGYEKRKRVALCKWLLYPDPINLNTVKMFFSYLL